MGIVMKAVNLWPASILDTIFLTISWGMVCFALSPVSLIQQ